MGWSDWKAIEEPAGYEGSAVYKVRLTWANGLASIPHRHSAPLPPCLRILGWKPHPTYRSTTWATWAWWPACWVESGWRRLWTTSQALPGQARAHLTPAHFQLFIALGSENEPPGPDGDSRSILVCYPIEATTDPTKFLCPRQAFRRAVDSPLCAHGYKLASRVNHVCKVCVPVNVHLGPSHSVLGCV